MSVFMYVCLCDWCLCSLPPLCLSVCMCMFVRRSVGCYRVSMYVSALHVAVRVNIRFCSRAYKRPVTKRPPAYIYAQIFIIYAVYPRWGDYCNTSLHNRLYHLTIPTISRKKQYPKYLFGIHPPLGDTIARSTLSRRSGSTDTIPVLIRIHRPVIEFVIISGLWGVTWHTDDF